MNFGQLLSRARKARGLTQTALGEALSPPVSLTTISLWEKDKRRPDSDQLRELCRVLHVSADVLLERAPFQLGPAPEDVAEQKGGGE